MATKATKKASAKASAKSSAKKSTPTRKSSTTKSSKRSTTPPAKRWSGKVKTDSTKPAPGIFKKSAKEIAANLEKKSVSPKGPGQAMQMLSFYENRGGKNLSSERKQALEGAKKILRNAEQQSDKKPRVQSKATKSRKQAA